MVHQSTRLLVNEYISLIPGSIGSSVEELYLTNPCLYHYDFIPCSVCGVTSLSVTVRVKMAFIMWSLVQKSGVFILPFDIFCR